MRKGESSEYNEIKAFLGEGTEFKGVLTFEGTVRIDGVLEGEVITKDMLIIGEKASLQADISAGTVVAKGKLCGNIVATKKIELRSNSVVVGNIKTPVLFIEEGAVFDGRCEMVQHEEGIKDKEYKGERNKTNMVVVSQN